jgi:endonuclease YncB( thermonuclease family)
LRWEYVPIRKNKYLSRPPPRLAFGGLALVVRGCGRGRDNAALRHWAHWPAPASTPAARDSETIWKRAGNPDVRHPVDVIRTIDGDTFEARVHLSPGPELTTRVRLRGIDAPELKASCAQELRMAEAAGDALRGLLDEGEVAIYHIGPDKYNGRVVADVATRRTPNVSDALFAGGHVRKYDGGHRLGWCADASR